MPSCVHNGKPVWADTESAFPEVQGGRRFFLSLRLTQNEKRYGGQPRRPGGASLGGQKPGRLTIRQPQVRPLTGC